MCLSANVSRDVARDAGAFAVANPRLGALKVAVAGVRGFAATSRLDARAETRLVAIVVGVAYGGDEVEESICS